MKKEVALPKKGGNSFVILIRENKIVYCKALKGKCPIKKLNKIKKFTKMEFLPLKQGGLEKKNYELHVRVE